MEELYAYALLHSECLISEERLRQKLDKLFLSDEAAFLLDWVTEQDTKSLVLQILARFGQDDIDSEKFGRVFLPCLQKNYGASKDLSAFAGLVYRLYCKLPDALQNTEPYWSLSIADDPLGWGDEALTRQQYESILTTFG